MATSMRWMVLVGTAACALGTRSVPAEEFRVYTEIRDVSAATKAGSPPTIARTVTLFHADKVYDFIESDGGQELIVFEPTRRRFRILNFSRKIVATAAFDEIKKKLAVAREETEREARVLSATDPTQAATMAMLKFQLSPDFDAAFDESSKRLSLTAEPLSYRVETMRPERPEIADAYLKYADWVCRLNYVLTIGPILPEPRLTLNRTLRERGVLPKSVILNAKTHPPTQLRAEHTFHLDLQENEREWIHQWESRLNSDEVRRVTLQQYQRELLTAQTE